MGLSNALFASVTGLDTTSTAISVVGDNIANVNTPGFKERRVEFADVLGQSISGAGGFSQIGAGAKVSRVSTVFSQGTFESTDRTTDLAIEGRGFFVLEGAQGRRYTRNGVFGFDVNGLLSTPGGQRVQGFGIDPVTGLPNGQIGDITVNTSVSPPRATQTVAISAQLDANDSVPAGGAVFDPTSRATAVNTSNFQTVLTVFDSLGAPQTVTTYFTKQAAPNSWSYNVTLGDPPVVQTGGSGTLTFNTSGFLSNATPASPAPVTFAFGGGAAAATIDWDFGLNAGNASATTQFANQASVTNSFKQDGFGAGSLQSISIDPNGFITGQFSNGDTTNLAQVGLANFPNVEGLAGVGNNSMIETRTSGQPIIGSPQSGSFGSVRSSSLESSTVDLAKQFVKMIIHQRAFQANTRTVSVTNELLANLVNLGG